MGGLELSPIVVGIFGVTAGVLMVATFHCIKVCLDYDHGRRQRRSPSPALPFPTADLNAASSSSNGGSFQTIRVSVGTNFTSTECKEETCSVCLSEFNEGDEVRVLPGCAHVFHLLCIDKWLLSHTNCPLCRANALCSLRDTAPPPAHAS